MRFIIVRGHKEWGWKMFGLLAKDASWFFGYSKAVSYVEKWNG